jgi:hypothetical protein
LHELKGNELRECLTKEHELQDTLDTRANEVARLGEELNALVLWGAAGAIVSVVLAGACLFLCRKKKGAAGTNLLKQLKGDETVIISKETL